MSSNNKPSINSLISAISGGLQSGQLQDLAQKISDDLDKVFSVVFTGPLPVNSAENLTDIAREALPPNIAWTDVANIFTLDQQIFKSLPEFEVKFNPGTTIGRFGSAADDLFFISGNLKWDGANWVTDTGNPASMIQFNAGTITFMSRDGTGILQGMKVNTKGAIEFGFPGFVTGAVKGEIILQNSRNVYGANAASTKILPLMMFDANDLLSLGSNPVGATTGEGNVSIPRAVTADMPVAGGTRNGILLINKTTAELCYYVNGLRYKIIGVAF